MELIQKYMGLVLRRVIIKGWEKRVKGEKKVLVSLVFRILTFCKVKVVMVKMVLMIFRNIRIRLKIFKIMKMSKTSFVIITVHI